MLRNHRRLARGLAVLSLALGSARVGRAQQDLPPLPLPIPDEPPIPASASPVPPHVIPQPAVVAVPPGGPTPSWGLSPADPAAVYQHPPGFVAHKQRSWPWRRLQGKFFGYPEEFAPRPFGSSVYDHGRVMTANGAAARLALFEYDFVPGTALLNARGHDQLAKAAAQLAVSPYPLLIERTRDNPSLADARRAAIVELLAKGPIPVSPDRVLVGMPAPNGLSGIDAQIVGANALTRIQQFGPPIPINSNGVNSPSGVTSAIPGGTLPGQ